MKRNIGLRDTSNSRQSRQTSRRYTMRGAAAMNPLRRRSTRRNIDVISPEDYR